MKLLFYNEVLPMLPLEEKYNLGSQIRRAGIGITSNIAEGYGRYHFQESMQFYRIARGSLYELRDHMISCYDLGYVSKNLLKKALDGIEESVKLINGFIRYIERIKETRDDEP